MGHRDSEIAFLLPDLRAGGAERVQVDLATAWDKIGIRTVFVVRKVVGDLVNQLPSSSSIVDLDSPRVRDSFWPLVRYLKDSRPDALIAAMWPLTVLAPVAAKVAGYSGRVVISEHSPLSIAYADRGRVHCALMRWSQRIAYPAASERIAVSKGVAEDLARLSRLSPQNFQVVHNPAASGCVDFSSPRPKELQEIVGPVILTVGTLKKVKRHDLLLEAFARLPSHIGATLCLLGEGQQHEKLKEKVRELKLTRKVIMPGYVANPSPWYVHSDIFVLSSDYEGFGNVLVEALEHGLPIVSTDCPVGPREILANGKFGRLVPPSDVNELADAIARTLEKSVDREELISRAQDFAVQSIADKYLEICLPTTRHSNARRPDSTTTGI